MQTHMQAVSCEWTKGGFVSTGLSRTDGKGIPILCISNEPLLLETRRLLLEWAGYEVVAKTTAEISSARHFPEGELVLVCHSVEEPERSQLIRRLTEVQPARYILRLERFDGGCHLDGPGASSSCRPAELLRCIHDVFHATAQ